MAIERPLGAPSANDSRGARAFSNREDLLVAALDCGELRPPTGEAVRAIRDRRLTHRRIGANRCEKSGRSAVRCSVQLNPSGS